MRMVGSTERQSNPISYPNIDMCNSKRPNAKITKTCQADISANEGMGLLLGWGTYLSTPDHGLLLIIVHQNTWEDVTSG